MTAFLTLVTGCSDRVSSSSGPAACSTNHRCSHLHRSADHQQRASLQVQIKDTIVVLFNGAGTGVESLHILHHRHHQHHHPQHSVNRTAPGIMQCQRKRSGTASLRIPAACATCYSSTLISLQTIIITMKQFGSQLGCCSSICCSVQCF